MTFISGVIFLKKQLLFFLAVLFVMTLLAESVVMVFPQEDDTIILFDDHSWYYHSEISWYDSIEFLHFDEDSLFAILEEKSYLSKEGNIIIKGIAMNTSMSRKKCEVSYAVLDSDRTIITSGNAQTPEYIDPGNLFPFTMEIENNENAKYISFNYILEVE